MSAENELENQIQKNATRIEELEILLEMQSRQIDGLLTELQVTAEQLTAFIEKKEHFTEENWEEMQAHRKALEAKLLQELSQVRDPQKAKKRFEERHVQPHWLFVR